MSSNNCKQRESLSVQKVEKKLIRSWPKFPVGIYEELDFGYFRIS